MKRILATLALLLIPAVALASWNIRQQDDGGAVWVDSDGDTVPVGDSGLVIELDDVSTASTAYVVTHRPGNIAQAYAVIHNALDAQSDSFDLTFWLQSAATAGQFTQISPGATLSPATGTAGDNDSVTFTDGTTVEPGQVIAVRTDGSSTGTSRGTITIVIE